MRAREGIDVDTSFHDLRHTGHSLAAGANLSDLKRGLGHSSSAAALRYMHSVDGRDTEIAKALSALAGDRPVARLQSSDTGEIVDRHRTGRSLSGV